MKREKINTVTTRLIIINTAVFLLGILSMVSPLFAGLPLGSETGGVYYPAVMAGQWWRIITAMFLHANIAHLASNMLALFALGSTAERMLGHWRYALTYFLAGIAGNLLTLLWDGFTGRYYFTVGASGAILGILGAILAVSVNKKDGIPGMNVKRVILACILMLIPSSGNISMSAHIGGFVGGFVSMYAIGTIFPKSR
ncbi:MAG: rhomboid family intramembrane serine protease [Lachnospiraceae bacterium]|nr:rhomboid family intramembrane serine protease [Lachnospiraceae bacterium]